MRLLRNLWEGVKLGWAYFNDLQRLDRTWRR